MLQTTNYTTYFKKEVCANGLRMKIVQRKISKKMYLTFSVVSS